MKFDNIVCAVDLSDPDINKDIIECVKSIYEKTGAKIHIVYSESTKAQYIDSQMPPSCAEECMQTLLPHVRAAMLNFIEKCDFNSEIEWEILDGYPVEEILKYVQRENIDMIVMGTHGRKMLGRLWFGSVANGIVQRATCPVLTIRPHTI